jgi:ABC-type branched-subunit amino acid transport system substrate-binding protein
VSLQSEDCRVLQRPETDETALLIGTLFAQTGPQAEENRAREQSALLAVEEINAAGGIPAPDGSAPRPLLLVACDTAQDAERATQHLLDVGTAAIVGPDSSQLMLALSSRLTVEAGSLLLSPVAVASSIAALQDRDLDWLMAPTAEQRAPLVGLQLRSIAERLTQQRGRPIKLGMVLREDAFGRDALASLLELSFGGSSLARDLARGDNARIESYGAPGFDPGPLVETFLGFAPDVIGVIGLSEIVPQFIAPLERRWGEDPRTRARPRPSYVLTEAARVPALLELANLRADLAERTFGTSVTPTLEALPIHESFMAAYQARFPGAASGINGMGATYDALYALAYAMASLPSSQVRGASLARALHERFSGTQTATVGRAGLSTALRLLSAGQPVSVLGTLGPLRWDDDGARVGGTLEMFCMEARGGMPRFGSAGVRLDLATQTLSGTPTPCGASKPLAEQPPPPPPSAAGETDAGVESPAAAMTPPPRAAESPVMPPAAAPFMPGSAPASGPQLPSFRAALDPIPCGARTCSAEGGEHCCVSAQAAPTCQSTSERCGIDVYCTSDAECPSGTNCCGLGQSAQCVPAGACAVLEGAPLRCDSSDDCAMGLHCCAHPGPGGTSFTAFACEAACDAESRPMLCSADADCQTDAAGQRCQRSAVLPSLGVCH